MDNRTFKAFVRELKLLNTIEHLNIIKFNGIIRDPQIGSIILVLQYANEGDLRSYLQKKQQNDLYKISWAELIKIAKEIVSGLIYLHDRYIIHRNLHSENILMDNGCALIADFLLSKNLNADSPATSSNEMGGMLAYIDPQYILHGGKRDKTSDIYSLGVLLWELTSGVPPFFHLPLLATYMSIASNKREKIIDDTPSDYAILYQECWSSNPAMRPPLNLVLDKLETLSGLTVEFITNNMHKDKSNNVIDSESESSDPGTSLVYTCRQNPDKSQT